MKKVSLLLLGVLSLNVHVWACDLCSIYLNLEPNDLRNSIGLNYRYRLFEHGKETFFQNHNTQKHATNNTVMSETVYQEEIFNSYDLWFRAFLSEKWQLNGTLSFTDNYYRENDSTLFNIAGMGDLTLLAKYMVFNTMVTDSSDWSFRLITGGGVQVPIGSHNKTYAITPTVSKKGNVVYGIPYEELDPHMQPTSGSLDFIVLAEFMARYKQVGLSTNMTYQFNTENSNQFRFANRFNANASSFYMLKVKPFTVAPNLGLSYEVSERDQFSGEAYLNSGGNALFLTFGTKLYYDSFAFGATYFNPIRQSLYDQQLPNMERVTADLTYYF